MKRLSYNSTKQGVASLYVVIFATILFGVITLSFIRIILSEKDQTSNDDLSQSAYDAALAGVEDAKIAVNNYYNCLSGSGTDCARYTAANLFGGQCDERNGTFLLNNLLYNGSEDTEVKIQESASNNSDQAYTCVIINNKVADYRSTLTSDTRTRVVPIGIGATSLDQVKYIEFRWYSEINGTVFQHVNPDGGSSDPYHGGEFGSRQEATTPPTISLSLLRTGANFSINDFNNSTSINTSTMILLPSLASADASRNTNLVNSISQSEINRAANAEKGSPNDPKLVKCEHAEFACTVTLGVSGDMLQLDRGGNAVLVVSMPYGDIVTDFAVTLKKADGTPIEFENVQISVDSTGRANQLVRRIESRLDPADIFFPYPEYEVTLTGNDENSLRKYFWITANCWTEFGTCANNHDI